MNDVNSYCFYSDSCSSLTFSFFFYSGAVWCNSGMTFKAVSDYGINTAQYRLIHNSYMIIQGNTGLIYDNTWLIHVAMGDSPWFVCFLVEGTNLHLCIVGNGMVNYGYVMVNSWPHLISGLWSFQSSIHGCVIQSYPSKVGSLGLRTTEGVFLRHSYIIM